MSESDTPSPLFEEFGKRSDFRNVLDSEPLPVAPDVFGVEDSVDDSFHSFFRCCDIEGVIVFVRLD
ncbi:hypothetical protein [Natronorubrum sp. DTA7]|uniref:hypothetical protein n=1 Tax=Natronorubrum sp. DTA7 TaxID=3447016 RepID=UPI003F82C4D9